MRTIMAALVAALTGLGCLSAYAQIKAEPESKPVAGGSGGRVAGFKEEPDSFWVESAKGRYQVQIETSAREARRQIHAARGALYGKFGQSLEQAQAELNKSGAQAGVSVYLGIADNGDLVGAHKSTGGPPKSFRYYVYTLNDDGTTKRVVLSGGRRDGEPAVFVKLYTSSGGEKGEIVVTDTDSIILKREL